MGKIISIANQKGGVGKTTTTVSLASWLCEAGMKVLIIDMDPQGNASSSLGVEKSELEYTSYDLITGECTFGQALYKTDYENLSIIPSDVDLAATEMDLLSKEDKEFVLKSKLLAYKAGYDYIIIDCPPSLNTLTLNALCCSDSVIIPLQCEYLALEGLSQLLETIELVKSRLNPKLSIDGVVFTMYDGRTNLSVQVVKNVRENFGQRIFNTIIPRNIRLSEAPSFAEPINHYDRRSVGSAAYKNLAKELLMLDGKKNAANSLSLKKRKQGN